MGVGVLNVKLGCAAADRWDKAQIVAQSLGTGERTTEGQGPQVLPDGETLLFTIASGAACSVDLTAAIGSG